MESITINNGNKHYEIESITPISSHVLEVVFADDIPESYGNIKVYTSGGSLCSDLPGYETVYQNESQTVYLSNDGSVNVPPEAPEKTPAPEPYVPTTEELLLAAQASKKAEISAACEKIIYKGVSVTLTDGTTERFALTEHDQLNLFGKQAQLAAGAERLEYHADGQPCRYYSAADMTAIVQAAMWHVSYHTTYCNALNLWIAGCQTAEEVNQIFYGSDVPTEYRSEVLDVYLAQIASMTVEGGDSRDEATV